MLRALKNEYIISPQLEKRVEDFFRHAALWNFTNVDLTQKDMNCVVQNVDFRHSLFTLTYYLENRI